MTDGRTVWGYAALLAALILLVCSARPAPAQVAAAEPYLGCGLAAVSGGDIAAARVSALRDAQAKVVLQALSAELTVADLAQRFGELSSLFLAHPETYLQSFRVIREQARMDLYQVSIQGVVQQVQLVHDLQAMGVLKPGPEKVRVLVMMAEKSYDREDPTFWWAGSRMSAASRFGMQRRLERELDQQGLLVVNPEGPVGSAMLEEIGQTAAPDLEPSCRFATRLGASTLVVGMAELSRTAEQSLGAVNHLQCDIALQLVDVATQRAAAQITTSALGSSIDEEAAAADAVGKACSQAVRQMLDRFYQMTTTTTLTGP